MTAEDIAYLRERLALSSTTTARTVLAVCDLAERALLTDDEAEAVGWFLEDGDCEGTAKAVLRRLLPVERVEHRASVRCVCGATFDGADPFGDFRNHRSAAHAGIGGTE